MRVLALAFVCCLSGMSNAQCVNGVCPVVRSVVTAPVKAVNNALNGFWVSPTDDAAVALVSAPVTSENCVCNGQCGRQGCTCPVVASAAPVVAAPVVYTRVLRSRPLRRMFGCK